jgi:hypothetical protein
MKKRFLGVMLSAVLVMGALAGCSGSGSSSETTAGAESQAVESSMDESAAGESTTAAEAADSTANVEGVKADEAFYAQADLSSLKGKKIGITIQSLENAYWAGVMKALEEVLTANGVEYTIVDCKDNSATQIGQIENFVASDCDLIMIHPSDANAVEDVAKDAQKAGIKVMCWDDPMTNTDGNWILNNTDLGIAIGELAGKFIDEHYSEDKKAEVALIGYPQTKILLERGNGIKEGLEKTAAGKYEIVAEQPGLNANEAQTAMETILQKNPDCKVVTGIGAGAMIGANEALITATGGKVPEDMGVFTADVTKQQLTQLMEGDQASRGVIGFEGSDEDTAKACAAMYALILEGKLEDKNVYRQVGPITAENASKVFEGMK